MKSVKRGLTSSKKGILAVEAGHIRDTKTFRHDFTPSVSREVFREDGGSAQNPVTRAFEDGITVDIRKFFVFAFEQPQTCAIRESNAEIN